MVAVALVALAAVLAWRDPPDDVPVLVAAHPVAPGVVLTAADVRVVRAPPHTRPDAALTDPAEVSGRVLAAPVGPGEPLTPLRLVGPESTDATLGPDAAAVPIRLGDPAVAALLRPGALVDVVTTRDGTPAVLARDARVLATRTTDEALVLLALPRDTATALASTALTQEVAVTLR